MITSEEISQVAKEREAAFNVKLRTHCEKLHSVYSNIQRNSGEDYITLGVIKSFTLGAVSMFVASLDLDFLGVSWVYNWINHYTIQQKDWNSGDLYLAIKSQFPKNYIY